MMNEKKWKIQITFLKILVRKAMLCNFTFPVCPSWPKNVFYCCKQNRMNFYHEILTTCILVMKASYQIKSMGVFFFLWNENHQILCSFWWHCSTMQKKFYHMQKLLVGFVFIFYLGKNIKTTVGFTININSNNIYTYGKQIYFRKFNTLLFEKSSNA